jgi:hypothetical protein
MGEAYVPDPVLLVVACFSRHVDCLEWGRQRLTEAFGPVALASAPFLFDQTRYYEASMGKRLSKQLLAFTRLVQPDHLKQAKLLTNSLEKQLAANSPHEEVRPINLDPGVMSLGKFQLATTKDQAHRVYLGDGVYAEVTLRYHQGAFEPWPWTYADYRQDHVLNFLNQARDILHRQLQQHKLSKI